MCKTCRPDLKSTLFVVMRTRCNKSEWIFLLVPSWTAQSHCRASPKEAPELLCLQQPLEPGRLNEVQVDFYRASDTIGSSSVVRVPC